MLRRFKEFSEVASKFSHEIAPREGLDLSPAENAELNLQIAKTVFSKWSLEILVMLYTMKALGFERLSRNLQGISSRVLSGKLKLLESKGFVKREEHSNGPSRVTYSLTEKGLIVSKLGEPVFLFFRSEAGAGPTSKKPTPVG